MTQDQLKIWFWNQFNSCYPVEHEDYPGNIILVYDEAWIRETKLASLLNQSVEYPKKHTGKLLFYLDFKNNHLDIDYNEIWSVLEQNYSTSYHDIRNLIENWLKLKTLTPVLLYFKFEMRKKIDKLKILTPEKTSCLEPWMLNEADKLNILK